MSNYTKVATCKTCDNYLLRKHGEAPELNDAEYLKDTLDVNMWVSEDKCDLCHRGTPLITISNPHNEWVKLTEGHQKPLICERVVILCKDGSQLFVNMVGDEMSHLEDYEHLAWTDSGELSDIRKGVYWRYPHQLPEDFR